MRKCGPGFRAGSQYGFKANTAWFSPYSRKRSVGCSEAIAAISMASAVDGTAVDIKPRDRVVVATRGIEPARTFEVKGIIRNAGLPLLILATLEEQ